MGVKKRKTKNKDGKTKLGKYWEYVYFIDNEKFTGTINESFAFPEMLPEGKRPEDLTKSEAEEICLSVKKHELNKDIEPNHDVLFDDAALAFYDDYLLKLEQRRKAAPHKNIRDYYNSEIAILSEHFTGMRMKDINRTHINAFKLKRRRAGVKDKTIRNNILTLSSIFTFANDEGMIEDNEMPNFRSVTKKLKKSKQRTRFLTEHEYDRLESQYQTLAHNISKKIQKHGKYSKDELDNPYNTRTRMRMVLFDIETGLRREELQTFLEKDVEFVENGHIKDGIVVRETKNGEDRWVPLTAKAKQLIQEQIQDKKDNSIASTYLFCKKDGTRFSQFKKGFDADCKRAGIKDLIPQDLRRTFGTWQLTGIRCEKKRIEEVSKLLGHSDISITQRAYAFLFTRDINL